MSPLRIALYVSLGVNLFIVGWWVGDVWRRPPPMEPRPFNVAGIAQQRLDPATMDTIGPALAAIDTALRSGFEERDAIFAELREAVTAEPYDADRVETLLSQLVVQRTATEEAQWDLVGDTLAKLSPADRIALADIIFLRPGGNRPPKPGDMPPPPMGNR
ncbi:Heavy-metal resistance [Devosia sp. YR412]|uniref:periplasmic heavy metal sensor n=1 Tax=Devosia sp. YR412 TaxID=1881030 RepID=UPI0008CCFB64|nr:periplasmic heavy metal sensor [Devosia sp. YR412]SEQ52342.1 Heavy-metal resistance [Devosia sp. YR412]